MDSLSRAVEAFFSSEEMFKDWVSRPAGPWAVEKLYKKTLAYTPLKPLEEPEKRFSAKPLQQLIDLYNNGDSNVWGVYNAATNWASHPDTKGAAHNVSRDRHMKVAKMLKSPQWTTLTSA